MLVLMQSSETIPQNLANLVWACAKMGVHPAGGFTSAYLALLQKQMPSTVPQDLTTTLWAYAALKEPLPATLLEAASQHLHVFLPQLKVQGMCQTANAYAYYRNMPSNGMLDSMALQFQQLQLPARDNEITCMRQAYEVLGLRLEVKRSPLHHWTGSS